jgi:putative ABC transport system substrate-binding protein
MRKPLFYALIFILVLLGATCGGGTSNSPGAKQQSSKRTIAVIKFTTHPALDETESGISEVITAAKESSPELANITLEYHNANGNPQFAKQLAETVTREDVVLIIAIATPAAQAVARTPSNIPLLYAAVADPEGAGILKSGRATGIRNVGENIIDSALMFTRNTFPKATRIGTIFNPAEQNSVYVQSLLKKLAPNHQFEIIQTEVTDKTQVAASSEDLAKRVDVIYSANDNTVNATVASIVNVTKATKTPFILGDLSTLKAGAFASVGLEYKAMGRDAGGMAVELLRGVPLSSVPPREPPQPQIWVNRKTADLLGIKLEGDWAARGVKIIEE